MHIVLYTCSREAMCLLRPHTTQYVAVRVSQGPSTNNATNEVNPNNFHELTEDWKYTVGRKNVPLIF